MRRVLWLPALLLVVVVMPGYPDDTGPCGTPPDAKKKRIKGGESFPPLPLPVTPLRRTERKRQPAPPTLVGKIVWGQTRSAKTPDGEWTKYADWNHDPNDVKNLLKNCSARLGLQFKADLLRPGTFSWDPYDIPVLYVTGKRALEVPDDVLPNLRRYVLAGGTLWGDACGGSDDFAHSFRELARRIFPRRPLTALPPDHPIFHCAFDIEEVEYSRYLESEEVDAAHRGTAVDWVRKSKNAPYLEGIQIGCRLGVIFSRYDLSCAWDSSHVAKDGAAILGGDALKLGMNMVTYSLAYFDLGLYLGRDRILTEEDIPSGGDFVFAQVKFEGLWDPDPSAFGNLLKELRNDTSMELSFRREAVGLTDPALRGYPFLYLTGHGDFRLTDAEVAGLGAYLKGGGFVMADACCGNLEFDRAFRREIARALPERALERLPAEHEVFATLQRIESVTYSPRAEALSDGATAPWLEGVDMGGATRVIYSRFDLGCGWEREDHPYTLAVSSPDAVRLGKNVIVYAMTH